MKYADAPGTASNTAETSPPAADSDTPTVFLRAFSFSPIVFEILSGIGMDEHGKVAMVQRQPGDQRSELVVLERHLIAEHRMRPDRLFVEAAHLDVERLLDLLAQCPGRVARGGIEVDVGVP